MNAVSQEVCTVRFKVNVDTLQNDGSKYVRSMPAFEFFGKFTPQKFTELIEEAKRKGNRSVYVPNKGWMYSAIRLDTWYAEAVLQHLLDEGIIEEKA